MFEAVGHVDAVVHFRVLPWSSDPPRVEEISRDESRWRRLRYTTKGRPLAGTALIATLESPRR
jgi:hypothetical protein